MLLAIDTSAGTSVAVVNSGDILAERMVQDTRRHAEVIGSLIVEVLAEANVTAAGLTGVAVGMGPGPFTGLRVGIVAANAFAFGAGKPVFRVVSHDALAWDHFSTRGEGPLLVTTDARRRERYWSAYRGVDEFALPVRAAAPGLSRLENLEQAVTDYASYRRLDCEWVSAASVGLLAELIVGQQPAAQDVASQDGAPREAVALNEATSGRPLVLREFAGPTPLYLRSPDVTPSTGPKRVSS